VRGGPAGKRSIREVRYAHCGLYDGYSRAHWDALLLHRTARTGSGYDRALKSIIEAGGPSGGVAALDSRH